MLAPLFVQTQPSQANFIQSILDGVANNPSAVVLAIALIVIYFATRGTKDELRESRRMLNNIQEGMRESQRASDQQEQKAMDMAINAINKVDNVVDSVNNMAQAVLESSKNYFGSAQLNADAHVKTTNMLVSRIAAMDEKRAEDEIYSNDRLLAQVNNQLIQSQETIASVVGTILSEARTMHEGTRRAITDNNEVLMAALLSTPPQLLPPPTDKSDSKTE